MTTRILSAPGLTGAADPRRSPDCGAAFPDFDTRASTTTVLACGIVMFGAIDIASVSANDFGNSEAAPRTTASGMRTPSGSRAKMNSVSPGAIFAASLGSISTRPDTLEAVARDGAAAETAGPEGAAAGAVARAGGV